MGCGPYDPNRLSSIALVKAFTDILPSYIPSECDPHPSRRAAVHAWERCQNPASFVWGNAIAAPKYIARPRNSSAAGGLGGFRPCRHQRSPGTVRWASPSASWSPPPRRHRPDTSPSPPLAIEDITHVTAAPYSRELTPHRRPEPLPVGVGYCREAKALLTVSASCVKTPAVHLATP